MEQDHPEFPQPSLEEDPPPRPNLDDAVSGLYHDLRRLAQSFVRRDRKGLTLSATELVHEAYHRLVGDERLKWRDERHFLAIAAIAMRRLLVEHARRRDRLKRGGEWHQVTFDAAIANEPQQPLDGAELLALDDALKRLAKLDPRQARVVEMRFFAGMGLADIAQTLEVNRRTVDRDWAHAKSWLRRELATTKP